MFRPLAPPLLVFASAILVYVNCIGNEFVIDDHQVIEGNPMVTEPGRTLEALTTPYHGEDGSTYRVFRPLATVGLALQWSVHGPAPWAFHLLDVLLHALIAVMVYFCCRAMLDERAALAAGILFAVHAIHTDAVTPAFGRAEVMAGMFALAGFATWRAWVEGKGAIRLAATAVLYLAGLLSKESAAPLPLFAIVWTVSAAWSRVQERTSSVVMGAAAAFVLPAAVYLLLRANALGGILVSGGIEYFAGIEGPMTALTLVAIGARYLALLVFPYPLSPDYSYDSIPMSESVLDPWVVAGLVALTGIAVATVVLLIRGSKLGGPAGLGLAWLIIFMLPATHVAPLMIPMAERMMYLGSVGWCLTLGAGFAWAAGRWRPAAIAVLAVYAAVLAGMTIERNQVWSDDMTIWSDVVATHPDNALALANLGGEMARAGRAGAAVAALERAVHVAPGKWEFREALADLLHESGRHEDESTVLLDAVRFVRPGNPPDPGRICTAVVEVRGEGAREACLADATRAVGSSRGH